MKKIFTLFLSIALTLAGLSQAPEKMSYQAVIRNANGELIKSSTVGMKISILQGSISGTAVYVETQNTSTNANGLVTIEIGGGTPVTGTFSGIDWSAGSYFIKTETDPTGGTNYNITGTSQMLSVPYAMYSKTAGAMGDAVTLSGDQTITGFKTFSKDLLVNDLTIGKGKNKISDNTALGRRALYLNTTGNFNTATGSSVLSNNTTGNGNTAAGYASMNFNTTGSNNTATGYAALYTNTTGQENTATGRDALGENTTGQQNTAIGYQALLNNTVGIGNTGNGYQSGYTNSNGNSNVFLGYQSGYYETGSNKLFIDNQKRASESDARVKSLIYGIFDANPANQILTINGNLSISNNRISNVSNPVNAQDAATKDYVDGLKFQIAETSTESDALKQQIKILEDNLIAAGLYKLVDIDGNQYNVVKIGTQVWMKENLRVTRFNDGTPIQLVTNGTEWNSLLTPAYCWYNNDINNKETYGALYNGHAIITGIIDRMEINAYDVAKDRLCPVGWRIPSIDDWRILSNPYRQIDLGKSSYGYGLMESGTIHWINGLGTNESGFTSLPAGLRVGSGGFYEIGTQGNFWSSSIDYGHAGEFRYFPVPFEPGWDRFVTSSLYSSENGLSVRCLKD